LLAEAILSDAAPEIARITLERAYAGDNAELVRFDVTQSIDGYAVMAGLVPAIHVVDAATEYAWMPGTGPGMTTQDVVSVCAKRMGTTFRVGELADFDRRLAALERMVEDAKSQPPGEMTRSVR